MLKYCRSSLATGESNKAVKANVWECVWSGATRVMVGGRYRKDSRLELAALGGDDMPGIAVMSTRAA